MANQLIEGSRTLLPPSMFFAPQIDGAGSFRLRPDPKYRHEHYLASKGLSKDQINTFLNNHCQKDDFFPGLLQKWYTAEMSRKAGVLEKAHQGLLNMEEIASRDKSVRYPWTRRIILELFPQLQIIAGTDKERELFNGKAIEEFIDEDAIPMAKGYIEWVRNYLPDQIKPRLYPLHEISQAQYFMDYVRLYGGGTVIPSPIPKVPKGEVFNNSLDYETVNMLNLVYLATITKITEDPRERIIYKAFHDSVSNAFKNVENIRLGVCLDILTKKVSKISILNNNAALGDKNKNKIWTFAYKIVQPYAARRFSSHQDGLVIFIEREKEFFAKMRKIQSGRFPISDAIGARFVLVDFNRKDEFINILKEELPDWTFEKEPGKTTSPESEWNEGEKYRVSWKTYPDFDFEMGIYWLRESRTSIGNWTQNLFGYNENFYRYRINQLLKYVIPKLFPEKFSGINWSDTNTLNMLYNYAHQKVLASALLEFPD